MSDWPKIRASIAEATPLTDNQDIYKVKNVHGQNLHLFWDGYRLIYLFGGIKAVFAPDTGKMEHQGALEVDDKWRVTKERFLEIGDLHHRNVANHFGEGTLATWETLKSGLVPCRVIHIEDRDPSQEGYGDSSQCRVIFKVTGTSNKIYSAGEILHSTALHVIPRARHKVKQNGRTWNLPFHWVHNPDYKVSNEADRACINAIKYNWLSTP